MSPPIRPGLPQNMRDYIPSSRHQEAAKGRIATWYERASDGVSRNVKILLATEPLWGIPVIWTRTYMSLFMAALGLSATQIGWIASLTLISQMLVAPFGGYVADRFGRKRTLIFFDVIAWIIPPLIWMIAQNVWYFAMAAVLNGFSMIISPSWNCLLVEDTHPARRPAVFAAFQLVVLGAGLFSPFSGWIVDGKGVVLGTRIIFGITGASIAIMTLSRALTIKETSVGAALVDEFQGTSVKEALRNYRDALAQGFKNRILFRLFLLSMINFAYVTIWNTYSALYMTHAQGLNLSPGLVALWPTFSSIFIVLTLVLLVPRVRLEKLPHWLLLSSVLLACGVLIFMLTPQNAYAFLAISAILIAMGQALINPVRDTFIANIIEDRQRAPLMAAINSVSMIVLVPLTPLAGRLFELNPQAPLTVLLVFLVIGVLAAGSLHRATLDPPVVE
jgi:DHA1 family tetracycline resistance protein-like MFS transporter